MVLTALALEHQAVVSHLSNVRHLPTGGTLYTLGTFDAEDCTWDVAVAEVGAGNTDTAAEVTRADLMFAPRVMFFVGVAGGRKDVALGDVVACESALPYESGKEISGFQPRPKAAVPTYAVEQLARAQAREGDWVQRIQGDRPQAPRAHVGVIASGEKVVADTDSDTAALIDTIYSQALAVDMEAYGFLRAAWRVGANGLVVRGISDLLDDKKSVDASGSQVVAAANAAAFAFAVLNRMPCEDPPRPHPLFPIDGTTADIERTPSSAAIGSEEVAAQLSWEGIRGTSFLARLRTTEPKDAEILDRELGESPSHDTLLQLASNVPAWLEGASYRVWETLAQFSDDLGEWSAAADLFHGAAERVETDEKRASLLARAAAGADLAGETQRGEQLLAEAEALDPQSISVILERARRADDPSARIEILAGAEGGTDEHRAYVLANRAFALLEVGDAGRARAAAQEAYELAPELPNVREAIAMVALWDAANRRQAGRAPDYREIENAAEIFRALREELVSAERWDESAALLGRTVDALVFAGQDREAEELLASARPEELAGSGADQLAAAALDALDFDRVVTILSERDQLDDQARIALAAALMSRDPERFVDEGVNLLERVFDDEDSRFRGQAAWILAGSLPLVGDSQAGHKGLAYLEDTDPVQAAIVRSKLADADPDEADAVLIPYQYDLRALRHRVALAAEAGNRERALELFDLFLAREPDPEVRLWRATFLEELPDAEAAVDAFAEIARDATVPERFRRIAYGRAARLADAMHLFDRVASFVDEWRELEPLNRRLVVHEVAALGRLGRYAEARDVLNRTGFEPQTESEAALVGEAIYWTSEGQERLKLLVELSDRFERAEETLELKIGVLGSASDTEGIDSALLERAGRSLVEFPERFPDSKAVVAVPAERLLEELEEPLRRRAEQGRELFEQFLQGQAPVALLAAHAGKQTGEVWDRLTQLPLGFSDRALEAQELTDAARAIDDGAVIDSSALYIAGGLDLADLVVSSLPRAVLPESVLADSIRGAIDIGDSGSEVLKSIQYDLEAGGLRLIELSPAETTRTRAREAGMLEFARRIQPIPDEAPDASGEMNQWLSEHQPEGPLRAVASVLAASERERLPVYADDRVVRLEARRLGLATFGTPALMRALRERGLLSPEAEERARKRLAISGAQGTLDTWTGVVEAIREDEYALTEVTSAWIRDPEPWRHDTEATVSAAVVLLEAVWKERPEGASVWIQRVLDAMMAASSEMSKEKVASGLLQAIAQSTDTPDELRALVEKVAIAVLSRRATL